jgi:hypothetical protein
MTDLAIEQEIPVYTEGTPCSEILTTEQVSAEAPASAQV